MNDFSQYVPNVYFEQIPIKNLVSNQEYQRHLSIKHVEKAAANFDLYQVNPVKISRRDGINYVFNGQHTIEIIALVSGSHQGHTRCLLIGLLHMIRCLLLIVVSVFTPFCVTRNQKYSPPPVRAAGYRINRIRRLEESVYCVYWRTDPLSLKVLRSSFVSRSPFLMLQKHPQPVQ